MSWWRAVREVLDAERRLLQRHRRLAIACVGLPFVPAVYALIYLYAMWDPAPLARALPVGLVNLDQGARYGEREFNLGTQMLVSIEQQGRFAYQVYADPDGARSDVRRGRLAFALEIPAEFSRRALPGLNPGAAQLTIYTSEGNNYSSAAVARRFAPEVAQRVNTMLAEARWDLVLSSAAGSRRDLESLGGALAELRGGASSLATHLARARDHEARLAAGSASAVAAAQALQGGTGQLAEGVRQLTEGLRQLGPSLRAVEARRPPEDELQALRQGTRSLVEGQVELGRGLDRLGVGARQLEDGLGRLNGVLADVPLAGARLLEGAAPLASGARALAAGLDEARRGHVLLLGGTLRVDEATGTLVDGVERSAGILRALAGRLPEDAQLDGLTDGACELAQGSEALLGGLRRLEAGARGMHGGLDRLVDGAGQLGAGIEHLRRSLPSHVLEPGGSARGLALAVEPVIEVVAPVPNHGAALTPTFVPLALWVGAVMATFLVHFRRVLEPLAGLPRSAIATGKLILPMAVVLLQALLMLGMLVGVLHVPLLHPGHFALTLAVASVCFLALVWLLVRLLGDLGKLLAVLLLIVQVTAAGALLPIEMSDAAFQVMHPYLPLTWVVRAFRASLFGAYDGEFWPALSLVAAIALGALVLGTVVGRCRPVPLEEWRPPLDIE